MQCAWRARGPGTCKVQEERDPGRDFSEEGCLSRGPVLLRVLRATPAVPSALTTRILEVDRWGLAWQPAHHPGTVHLPPTMLGVASVATWS